MSAMAVIDIVILSCLALAAVWGYRKGIIGQAGAVGAIVAGVAACRVLGAQAVELIFPEAGQDASPLNYYGAVMVVYAVIYFAAYYAVVLVARMLKFVVHAVLLGPVDRMAGALFNILKVMIVMSFLLNACEFFRPDIHFAQMSRIAGGGLVELIMAIAPAMAGAMTAS